MAYTNTSLTTVSQLKKLAGINKNEIDTLTLAQAVLDARMDAQVTASTDTDADYAAEVADARVDAWTNEHASLGANIRDGQQRLSRALQQVQENHQGQLDALSTAFIDLSTNVFNAIEARRLETLKEEESRIAKETILQDQIDTLATAILDIATTLLEMRERIRSQEE